jgi:hypothetical protein
MTPRAHCAALWASIGNSAVHPLRGRQPTAGGGGAAVGAWYQKTHGPPAVRCGCARNAAVFIGLVVMSAGCSIGWLPGNKRQPRPSNSIVETWNGDRRHNGRDL